MPPDLIRQIGKQFEMKTSPANGYGLTETTSAIISNSGVDYHAQPDSIGRPVATADVKIVDEHGNELGDEQIGELLVRGPNVIPGYWNNPEATESAFGGGWFRTGDLGYRDARGLHYVVDRKKDVIIRGGENVYCAEVEAAILEHPMVKDVAVIGLPDAKYGEEVAAVIQVRDAARSGELAGRTARGPWQVACAIQDSDGVQADRIRFAANGDWQSSEARLARAVRRACARMKAGLTLRVWAREHRSGRHLLLRT